MDAMKLRKAANFLLVIFVVSALGVALPGRAQQAETPSLKERFVGAQKSNAAAQRQYTWMSRTELLVKGESKNVKVESVRYSNTGQREKTLVGSTPQPAEPDGGRLKKRIVKKKKAEFKELMEGLAELAQSYAHLTPEQTQALAQGASISRGQEEMEGSLRIQATSVVVPGDGLTLWVNPATFLFHRVEIDSVYEDKPMKLTVLFTDLPQGPTVPARVTLDYPDKQIRLLIENYDYQPLPPAAASGAVGRPAAPGGVSAGLQVPWGEVADGSSGDNKEEVQNGKTA